MAAQQLDEIKSKYGGTWIYDRSDNFEAFLKAQGVNMVKRKLVQSMSPTCIIKVSGGKINISMEAGPMTKNDEVTLGEEMETDVQGEKGKVIVTYEDGKLRTAPSPNNTNPKVPKSIREILANGEMCLELHAGETVAKRYFKKK